MNEAAEAPEAHVVFASLAELIYGAETFEEVYQAIVDAAPYLVTGCDHASMMLREAGRFVTVGVSDDIAAIVDGLERSVLDGPCVDAISEEAVQRDADLTDGSQWPTLAKAVLTQTPVRGMAGYRLLIDGRKVGALNIFSDTPDALTGESADQGAIFASFASVALMAMSRSERAESLQRGLDSNREIGKAVGLLMSAHRISSDEAFQLLRKASADLNIKLAKVAEEVVGHHDHR